MLCSGGLQQPYPFRDNYNFQYPSLHLKTNLAASSIVKDFQELWGLRLRKDTKYHQLKCNDQSKLSWFSSNCWSRILGEDVQIHYGHSSSALDHAKNNNGVNLPQFCAMTPSQPEPRSASLIKMMLEKRALVRPKRCCAVGNSATY